MDQTGFILIIDESAQPADPMFDVLRSRGWQIAVAASLATGAVEMDRIDPVLIIIRERLPDGDGIEFVARHAQRMPFVVWAAEEDPLGATRALDAGAMDHIVCSGKCSHCLPATIQRSLHHWNVGQRHRATAEHLATERSRLANIIEGTRVASWEWEIQTGKVVFSESWATMLGYTLAELEPISIQTWLSLVHPDDADESKRRLDLHFKREYPFYDFECRMRHRQGHWIWVHDRGKVIRWRSDGLPDVMFGTHADITRRKVGEERLRESLLLHRRVIQTAMDGFCILDSDGRVIETNDAYCRIVGYSSEEILQRCICDFDLNETPSQTQEHLAQVKHAGQARFETRHGRRDGGVVELDVSVQYLPNNGGIYVSFLRDITEQKQATRALETNTARLLRAEQVAGIGHFEFSLATSAITLSRGAQNILRLATAAPSLADVHAMVKERDERAWQAAWQRLQEGGEPVDLQLTLKPADGATPTVIQVIAEYDRAHQQVFGVINDLTERHLLVSRLIENSYHLERAQELAHMGSFRFDIPADHWSGSPNLDAIFGIDENYPRRAVNWLDLIPPSHRQAIADYLTHDVICGRAPFDRDYPIIRFSDGEERWLHGTGELELDEAGQPAVLVGTIQDITEERRSEEILRLSEERFRTLLQRTEFVAVQGYAPDGSVQYWNRASELLYGYTAEEVVGRNLVDLIIPAEAVPVVREQVRQMAETGVPIPAAELQLQRKDGSRVSVFSSHAIIQQPGRPQELFCVDIDLTALRQAEHQLRLQSNALDAADNAIVITDCEGKIEWANAAFTRVTGYDRNEAIGRNPRELIRSDKHDPSFYADMWGTITAGKVWHGEITNRRKDRSLYVEDMTITPILDERGMIIRYIAVKQDITQQKALEEQLRHSQKMDAIGRLAGGVAHDFNNILAAVLLHVGLLEQELGIDEETRLSLGELAGEIKRGANLTRQLLTFSRKEAMQCRSVEVRDLVLGLVKMVRRLVREDIAIDVSIDEDLPRIFADPGMIEQVLLNLCINARDAMPQGGRITLCASAAYRESDEIGHPDGHPGTYLNLRVIDTGEGIPPENLPRIFEPFFTTKAAANGTGLGLATVYGIVRQHQGWLQVDSVVGDGSTFQIHLPAASETLQSATSASTADHPTPQGRGETLLLVEDEATLRRSLAKTLERNGYRVLVAADGREALSLWETHAGQIALMLTDIMMPNGVNGADLIARCCAEQPSLAVIASSGYRTMRIAEKPNLKIMQKPFDRAGLLRTVRDLLDRA